MMKRFAAFIALVMLSYVLCVFAVSAKTYDVDGVEVTLSSDKDEYMTGDDVTIKMEITNTNDYAVTELTAVPAQTDGFDAYTDGELPDKLASGESASVSLVYGSQVGGEKNPPISLVTFILIFTGALLLVVAIITVIVVLIVKKKKAKNTSSLLLTLLLLPGMMYAVPDNAQAKDVVSGEASETVYLDISVEKESMTFGANISFEYDKRYTVSFETNGADSIDPVKIEPGTVPDEGVIPSQIPEKDGFIFSGWYTDKETTEIFDKSEPVNGDITLYAGWVDGDREELMASYVASKLMIGFAGGDNPDHVSRDIVLPYTFEGLEEMENSDDFEISWESSDESTVDTEGKVTRSADFEKKVTLTLTVEYGDAEYEKEYELTVVAANTRNREEIPNSSVVDIENMNEGLDLTVSYNEDKTQVDYIDGKYTEIVVENADDALDAIASVHSIIGLYDAYEELEPALTSSDEYGAEYTFAQYYNGYRVYGRNVTVSADKYGICDFLNSGVYSSEKLSNAAAAPSISEEDAADAALGYFGGECEIYTDKTEIVYYTLGNYAVSPVLAYSMTVAGKNEDDVYVLQNVFVNAGNGTVITSYSMIYDIVTTISGRGKNELDEILDFPISYYPYGDGKEHRYYMIDTERRIYIHDESFTFSNETIFSSDYNRWDDNSAVSAYTNTITVYDWYKDVLGRNSIDGKGVPVQVVVHNPSMSDNAFWSPGEYTLNFCDGNYDTTTAAALDVVAHEYTHGVFGDITNNALPYSGATGAINEGYADIFGCLIQGDWEMGEDWITIRDASDPTRYGCPDSLESEYFNENNDVHTNSSLIYYPAYLMHRDGLSEEQLARLWYKSMFMGYSADSDYHTVRRNVLKAAERLGMAEADIAIIKNSFDTVAIFGPRGRLFCYVKNTKDEPMDDIGISISHNGYEYVYGYTDGTGEFSTDLDVGDYSVHIAAEDYIPYVANTSITENDGRVLIINLVRDGVGDISGKVVSATTAQPLSGVTVRVYPGHNIQGGGYVEDTVTDSNGNYSIEELEAGYYTVEMELADYSPAYTNVIVENRADTIADVSLSPIMTGNDYRVVLTWGTDPRDLDAHIEGTRQGDGNYHVYFSSMNAYGPDGVVANLDVDDQYSEGPETITFVAETDGSYFYYVHLFTGYGTLSGSGAMVVVYNGGREVARYSVPSGSGGSRYWKVFRINNGILSPINSFE